MSPISRFRNSLFCGKKCQRVAGVVEAPDRPPAGKFPRPAAAPRTCNHCLSLCDEIHSEALGVQPGGPRQPGLTAPELPASGAPRAGVVWSVASMRALGLVGSMAAAEGSQWAYGALAITDR